MILGAHVSTAGGVSNAPLRARELDTNTYQIFTKNQSRWSDKPLAPDDIERYLANCEECSVTKPMSHDAYLINLCARDPAKLKMSREAFLDEMARADQLRIPYLVMHPGSHLGAGEEAGLKLVAESLRVLFDRQTEGKVRVLLETTAGQGTNLGHRFEQIAELIRLIENEGRIGVCIDTCHVFAGGYDIRTPESYGAMIDEFDRVVGLSHLFAFHFNDSKRELASRIDRHEEIGDGLIGLEPFGFFLNDPRFAEHPAVLEVPGDMEGYARNLARLRSLMS